MLTEDCIVFDSNDIVRILWIMFLEIRKNVQLNTCLMVKPLLVSDDFYGHKLVGFVVVAFQSLTKTTFSKRLKNFVSVAKVVFHDNLVITSIIIETLVVRKFLIGRDLCGA